MKALMTTKVVDSRTNKKIIRAGEKGKGRELIAFSYWPDSGKSVEAMEQSLFDWKKRHPHIEVIEQEW
jgi:hypothetical protein